LKCSWWVHLIILAPKNEIFFETLHKPWHDNFFFKIQVFFQKIEELLWELRIFSQKQSPNKWVWLVLSCLHLGVTLLYPKLVDLLNKGEKMVRECQLLKSDCFLGSRLKV
jgi:hypothetical protein